MKAAPRRNRVSYISQTAKLSRFLILHVVRVLLTLFKGCFGLANQGLLYISGSAILVLRLLLLYRLAVVKRSRVKLAAFFVPA